MAAYGWGHTILLRLAWTRSGVFCQDSQHELPNTIQSEPFLNFVTKGCSGLCAAVCCLRHRLFVSCVLISPVPTYKSQPLPPMNLFHESPEKETDEPHVNVAALAWLRATQRASIHQSRSDNALPMTFGSSLLRSSLRHGGVPPEKIPDLPTQCRRRLEHRIQPPALEEPQACVCPFEANDTNFAARYSSLS
jgi:hypothetical protein